MGRPITRGFVAEVDPYPYGDPGGLLRAKAPSGSRSTRSRIPRNLGAVCRSAEFAGATGVVVPERRSAAVTAATCKASAGAVEQLVVAHVRNLVDCLGEAGVQDREDRR